MATAFTLRILRVGRDGSVEPARDLEAGNGCTWVDITGGDGEALRRELGKFSVSESVLERVLDPDVVSGAFAEDGALILELPMTGTWQAAQHPRLSIVCLPGTVVTIHATPAPPWMRKLTRAVPASRGKASPCATLVTALLDALVDHATALTLEARREIEHLEAVIESEDVAVGRRILELKRALGHFEIALEAQHRTATALLSQSSAAVDLAGVRAPLRDVVAHLEHSLRYVERMEDRLSELYQHHVLVLQDRTNNRLRILTILSAVFMPLTLIAGIYGMNFRYMPELAWRYGYPLVLALMAAIAAGALVYFWRKGWFR